MSLRLIEIVLPEGYRQELVGSLEQQKVLDIWQEEIEEGRLHLKILVSTENSEEVLDLLEKRFSHSEGFRIILLPVEASIPRPEIEEKPKEKTVSVVESQKNVSRFIRISREELYADIEKTVRQSWVYFIMIVYAAIVASIGIFRNNVVFIIGAMVIAPMLGPNLALSFATTL
ncbi:MAG: TIGR00341 family protein, partial [Candidatus Aminicenantes bacterium]